MSECLPGCPCGENPEPKKVLVIVDDFSEPMIKDLVGETAMMEPPKLQTTDGGAKKNPPLYGKRQARLQRLRDKRRCRPLCHGETE